MIITKNISNVTLKKIEEPVTGKMGLSWIYHSIKHFGLQGMVEQTFAGSKKSNREKPALEKIMTGALMLIAGGNRVEDIEVLRQDTAFVNSLGWESMVSPDTFLNFLEEKKVTGKLAKIMVDTVSAAMKISKEQEFTYDSDATFMDCEKECAMFSYQGKKQMSALLGYIPELSGMCATVNYRQGNVHAGKGILSQLRSAESIAELAGKRIRRFRSDSAAHQMAIFLYCEKRRIEYFVSLDKNKEVMNEISEIKNWNKLESQPDKEWAEFIYVMTRSKKKTVTMRAMVLRWKNPDQNLFEQASYCYHVIATNNMDIAPMDWLEVHNGRMNSENYHKEIKNGFSLNYVPSQDIVKSRNFFYIGAIAYNILQLMKLFYLVEPAKTWTIKTLRLWFINTCGRFTSHARQIICNIINATDITFRLFQHCLSRLVICTS